MALFDDLFNGWNGMWGDIGRKLSAPADLESQLSGGTEQWQQPSRPVNRVEERPDPRDNIARILGIGSGIDKYPSRGYSQPHPGGGNGKMISDYGLNPSPNEYQEEAPDPRLIEDQTRAEHIRQLMEDLQMGTENSGLVDEAFAGSLAAIEKARSRAGENFKASDAAIQGLTQGHVNEIKTVDRKAVQDNAAEYSGALNENYTNSKNTLAADQKAEMNARAAMLQRLGIQEAGLGEAGQEQSKAISRLTENNANEQSRASTYKAADLTRNTELAAAQATEGVERQSDLRRQLDGINANLDQSTATVENSKAQARISAGNADREAYLKQLQFYSDELAGINEGIDKREQTAYDRSIDARDFAAKNQPKSVGGALDVANQQVMNMGENPAEYADTYAQVMAENTYDSRSGQDKIAYAVAQMRKKNPRLSPNVALRYVMAVENHGTDKGNTPLQIG